MILTTMLRGSENEVISFSYFSRAGFFCLSRSAFFISTEALSVVPE